MSKTTTITSNKSGFLAKIKSKYILKEIFDNLSKIRMLKIINYNKTLQKRLNKNLYNYIDEYYKIEIEIIPSKNEYGKFICIPKRYESFYHIYFNDSKKDTKIKTIKEGHNISKIKVILDYNIKSLTRIFKSCGCIQRITFSKFKREDITDMSYWFKGCFSLEELDLSNLITKNVTIIKFILADH